MVMQYSLRQRSLLIVSTAFLSSVTGLVLGFLDYPLSLYLLAAMGGAAVAALVFSRPVVGLYLFLFLLPSEYAQELSKFTLIKGVGIVLAMAWGLEHLRYRTPVHVPGTFKVWLLFLLWCAISMLWAANPKAGFGLLITMAQMLSLLVIIYDLLDTRQRLAGAIAAAAAGAAAFLILPIYTYVTSPHISRLQTTSGVSPNHYVTLGVFVFAICLTELLAGTRSIRRGAICLLGLVVAPVPAILAGAKSATYMYAMVAVVVAVLYWVRQRQWRRLLFLILFASSVWAVTSSRMEAMRTADWARQWSQRLELAFAGSGSLGGREHLWPLLLAQWREKPLVGWGIGTSVSAGVLAPLVSRNSLSDPLGLSQAAAIAPHNLIVWLLVDVGIVGLLLFLVPLVASILPIALRFAKLGAPPMHTHWYIVLTIFFYILSLALLEDMAFRKVFWVALALFIVLPRLEE